MVVGLHLLRRSYFLPLAKKRRETVLFLPRKEYGHFEVRHEDGSGTTFYDSSQYAAPRGDYQVYEDANGNSWYGIHGNASVERRPVYENGEAVYGADGNVKTISVETVRYNSTPSRYAEPTKRNMDNVEQPRRKRE